MIQFAVKYGVAGILLLFLLGFSSCKTTRVATTTAIARPISSGKLIRNIENNAFEYRHFSIKRINCQFDNGKTKASFKASIQAEKDKRLTVMLSKLNIPVGRLWLTPDSVKFINYLEKNYFTGDYNSLSSVLGMDVDFETIHAIISNNIFSLRDEKRDKDNQDYQTRIDSGMYVLEAVKKIKAQRNTSRNEAKRPSRRISKRNDEATVHQLIYVDPGTYKLRKIKLEDPENSRNLDIDFSDFIPVEKQLYPGEIKLDYTSPESYIQLRIKMNGFSLEEENEVRFKIPEKFTRINL